MPSDDSPKIIFKSIFLWLFRFVVFILSLILIFYFFSDQLNIFETGVLALFIVGIGAAIKDAFQDEGEKHHPIKIGIKDWINIEFSSRQFSIFTSIASIGLGIWLIHIENVDIRKGAKIGPQIVEARPNYISEDEWKLDKGILAYKSRDYDIALNRFSKITKLEGSQFVRWKLYESLSKLRVLKYKKFSLLQPVDEKDVDAVIFTLSSLSEKYPDDVLNETVNYWLAQTYYHFSNNPLAALKILEELRQQYKWGNWKEGSVFYSAEIYFKQDTIESVKESIRLYKWLMKEAPQRLVRFVPDSRDYIISSVVPTKLQQAEERLLKL